MAAAISQPTHPYFEEIGRLFYNYRLAQFNRRYYTVLLERAKKRNLWTQVAIGVLTAVAVVLFTIPPSLSGDTAKWVMDRLNPIAAVFSALAFVANVVAPVFGWNQTIDEITARIHAWHYAERQLESALRFLHHSAQTKREADLQVQFADEAFGIANNYPDIGKQDMKLSTAIRLEVEKAIPADYVWTAL
jgi:hypothetical protein